MRAFSTVLTIGFLVYGIQMKLLTNVLIMMLIGVMVANVPQAASPAPTLPHATRATPTRHDPPPDPTHGRGCRRR